ncbi:hypothetical protein [Calothrix sp. NIES-2100]|uniref:hypothetical protein n=1 Tax=Calothrix sp. NIES-2100 TaxID=1954172 RepID=UPI0030DD2FF5
MNRQYTDFAIACKLIESETQGCYQAVNTCFAATSISFSLLSRPYFSLASRVSQREIRRSHIIKVKVHQLFHQLRSPVAFRR